MRIFALGYSGTGSSAIVHLLNEYENCKKDFGKAYEHIIFYAPHGLFYLEDVILRSNSLYRSDAALNDFYDEMKRLNDNDFAFFGGYKKKYGNRFMQIVDDFINSLVEFSRIGGWSNDYSFKFSVKQTIKDCLGLRNKDESFRPFGMRLDTNGKDGKINFCFDSPDEFYRKARVFIDNYFDMIGYKKDQVIVTDQLLQPQFLKRFMNYSHQDDRFIIFRRDCRDIFINSKYIRQRHNHLPNFPTDAEKFSSFYSRFLRTEPIFEDKRILRLNFEDLVYKYDETVEIIESFIGKDKLGRHIHSKKIFNPEQSIKNTQLFTINDKWKEECKIIEMLLHDYLYDFPYKINTSIEETSDPNPDTSIIKE